MEPEATTPLKGKKFLKIALWVLATLTVLLGTAYFLTALKNARKEPQPEAQPAPELPPPPTEAEVLQTLTATTTTATTLTSKQTKAVIKTLSAQHPQTSPSPATDKTTQAIINSLSAPH